jgi:excisionase family DNA binding protein
MPVKKVVKKKESAMNSTKMRTVKMPMPTLTRRGRMHPEATSAESEQKSLLTLTEAAQLLGHVHRTTIMRWVKENRLRCIRLSRKVILFELAEIERFVREHRHSGN